MNQFSIEKNNLIHKGAEAALFIGTWFGKEVIFKERKPKKYRIDEIDKKLRYNRTQNEARALIKVKNYNILVPQVFEIDANSSTIVMKYIKGKKLKNLVSLVDSELLHQYFFVIGEYVARLHLNGHIHGDITTSNVIITPNQEIFLIDFGLHEYSESIEDKSVDLHLLKRVLISSHGDFFDLCFNAFLEGYTSEYIKKNSKEHIQIIKNIEVIEKRGRYIKQEDRR